MIARPETTQSATCRYEPAAPADLPALLRIWAAGMQQTYPAFPLMAEHRQRFRRNFR